MNNYAADIICFISYFLKLFTLTTEHTNNLNALIIVVLYHYKVSIKMRLSPRQSFSPLLSAVAQAQALPSSLSSSVKLHISKPEKDSQKNFQKDKKPIRCVKSLTFRNHLGKAAHADLSTKVWML